MMKTFKAGSITVFVRVLNTRIDPDAVPTKIFLPVGSNRAAVIGDLHDTSINRTPK